MTLAHVSGVTAQLDGVVERTRDGLLDWRYHGRLISVPVGGASWPNAYRLAQRKRYNGSDWGRGFPI